MNFHRMAYVDITAFDMIAYFVTCITYNYLNTITKMYAYYKEE